MSNDHKTDSYKDHNNATLAPQRADQNSYSKSGMFTFVASMIASFGILIYVAFLSGGIDLKELPNEKPAAKEGAPAVAPEDPNAPKAEGVQAGSTDQQPVAPAPDVKAPAASPTPDKVKEGSP
jgi:hypothetical protein